MLDFEGTALSPADRELLREPAVGGVLLFSRNYASPAQLTDLVSEIRGLRQPPLLVAVDHEGGRVQRFRDGFTAIPPMRVIGGEYRKDPTSAATLARQAGWLIASELRAVGIDLCFAPCVDLDWGVSEVIGDRSFARRPEVVAELAMQFARGLKNAGMGAVAKHFPGHGAVVADSHLKLPLDRREYGEILDDLRPYDRLIGNAAIAGVMTAHVIYQSVDEWPASFSSFWVQRELRERLGFDGAVFCDDLSMKAAANYGPMPERARLALAAGCDMVLVCNDRPAALKTVQALRDYSNPLSLVRLARLHGTGKRSREALQASDEWRAASTALKRWTDPPELTLDA
ncbi:MAG TPA: beta-N-acetylhexosaminidase [Woeseiaceae bacterium]|nr:beta-N-acetylhexosaminidase [Woeseiaceae bacterium]